MEVIKEPYINCEKFKDMPHEEIRNEFFWPTLNRKDGAFYLKQLTNMSVGHILSVLHYKLQKEVIEILKNELAYRKEHQL